MYVSAVQRLLQDKAAARLVTMAEASLSDGQRLLAFNDLFIGPRSHVSARYRIAWQGKDEPQSSSGVLVATGAGSTGWLSSVFNMTRASTACAADAPPIPCTWSGTIQICSSWCGNRLSTGIRRRRLWRE
jgi:hypothetical protein